MAREIITIVVRGGLPGGTVDRQATIVLPGCDPLHMRAWPGETPQSFQARVDAVKAAVVDCEGAA